MNQIKLDKEVKIIAEAEYKHKTKTKRKKHIISANKPLSARQKKAIADSYQKSANAGQGRAASAQQTIPYKKVYPDGICKSQRIIILQKQFSFSI